MKKTFVFLLIILSVQVVSAQVKKKGNKYNKGKTQNTFLHKQWWIGLKGGVNFTNPIVKKSYSIITPTNYAVASAGKKYDQFSPISTQLGLEACFYFKGFSVSVQPTFENIRFSYQTSYSWTDSENINSRLDLIYAQEQQVQYITVPLLLRYEFGESNFSPYLNIGMYGSFLVHANTEVKMSGTDYGSGGTQQFESEAVTVGATNLFQNFTYGIVFGGGVFYNLGNVRLSLDLQYRHGLSLINSPENRYNNDRLSGIGDAMDDITIQNINVSAGIQFPLRFLSKGFKSSDKI